MTRLELLHLVVGRARSNGFELRRWYTTRLELPWISAEAAVSLLATQRRYYALIFSQDFAKAFWKAGAEITFDVPPQSFQRTMPDGSTRTVQRKPYIRRSSRPNAWRYHLRQMALAEEPLRYLRKYLHIEEEPAEGITAAAEAGVDAKPTQQPADPGDSPLASAGRGKKSQIRPLPAELPGFLKRPYRPAAKKA